MRRRACRWYKLRLVEEVLLEPGLALSRRCLGGKIVVRDLERRGMEMVAILMVLVVEDRL